MSQMPPPKMPSSDSEMKELLAHVKSHTDFQVKLLSATVEMQAKLNVVLDALQAIIVGLGNEPDRIASQIDDAYETYRKAYLKDALEPVEYPHDTSEPDP
jgi:hypothetical protein